jgi:hypothetical protein
MNFIECWKAMEVGQEAYSKEGGSFTKITDDIICEIRFIATHANKIFWLSDTWEIKREKKRVEAVVRRGEWHSFALFRKDKCECIESELPENTDIKATFEWEK